jgi:hypothetical protein
MSSFRDALQTLRQSNRRLTRKTNGFSKEISGLEKQLWVSLASYHFVLAHHSLRVPLAPIPTRGSGSPKLWQAVTPVMAAGLTDPIWNTSELLLSHRVPVEFLNTIDQLGSLFPAWDQAQVKDD